MHCPLCGSPGSFQAVVLLFWPLISQKVLAFGVCVEEPFRVASPRDGAAQLPEAWPGLLACLSPPWAPLLGVCQPQRTLAAVTAEITRPTFSLNSELVTHRLRIVRPTTIPPQRLSPVLLPPGWNVLPQVTCWPPRAPSLCSVSGPHVFNYLCPPRLPDRKSVV